MTDKDKKELSEEELATVQGGAGTAKTGGDEKIVINKIKTGAGKIPAPVANQMERVHDWE